MLTPSNLLDNLTIMQMTYTQGEDVGKYPNCKGKCMALEIRDLHVQWRHKIFKVSTWYRTRVTTR